MKVVSDALLCCSAMLLRTALGRGTRIKKAGRRVMWREEREGCRYVISLILTNIHNFLYN